MKISENRIKEIIKEEKEKLLLERKVPGAKLALREIAMLSAKLYDNEEKLAELNEKELLILKNIAESLDILFFDTKVH